MRPSPASDVSPTAYSTTAYGNVMQAKTKVKFSSQALKQEKERRHNPTLNKDWIRQEQPESIEPSSISKEGSRISSGAAMQRALEIHNAASGKKQTLSEALKQKNFFQGNPLASENATPAPKSNSLRVGTDCSGMEAPIQALRNLGVSFTHVFSSDNDEKVRKTIRANYPPEILYKDITKRDVAKVPSVDLYLAGFPCQPFSNAGKKQGFQDSKNRGTIFFRIREYINKKRPKVFVLENVKGITSLGNGRYLKAIMRSLRGIRSPVGDVRGELTETSCQAYRLEHRILNTKDHGIPQDRPRWYCVGIRKDVEGDSFEFLRRYYARPLSCSWTKRFQRNPQKRGQCSAI